MSGRQPKVRVVVVALLVAVVVTVAVVVRTLIAVVINSVVFGLDPHRTCDVIDCRVPSAVGPDLHHFWKTVGIRSRHVISKCNNFEFPRPNQTKPLQTRLSIANRVIWKNSVSRVPSKVLLENFDNLEDNVISRNSVSEFPGETVFVRYKTVGSQW